MTESESGVERLRALIAEATPGPWKFSGSGGAVHYVTAYHPDASMEAHVRYNWDDARLIALTPQLAELCADMAESLQGINAAWNENRSAMTAPGTPIYQLLERLDALLEGVV